MLIVAGSYERFLFGFNYDAAQPDAELRKAFTNAAHKGAVRCLAAAGQYMACGGSDDTVHIYNMRGNRDLGFLMVPGEGAVTAAAFHTPPGAATPSHLLTGSADGTLSIWNVGGEWDCLKTLRAHTKEVTGVAVHPSGRVALSISRQGRNRDCGWGDGSLRMWDLIKGRSTFTTKLPAPAEAIAFGPRGDTYALVAGSVLGVYDVTGEGAAALATLTHPSRILCHAFHGDGVVLTGCEDGSLRAWALKGERELVCIPSAHARRVRGLAVAPQDDSPRSSNGVSSSSSSGNGQQGLLPSLVASASSDGTIRLWDLERCAAEGSAEPVAETDTRARITCLTVMLGQEELAARAAAAAEVARLEAGERRAKKLEEKREKKKSQVGSEPQGKPQGQPQGKPQGKPQVARAAQAAQAGETDTPKLKGSGKGRAGEGAAKQGRPASLQQVKSRVEKPARASKPRPLPRPAPPGVVDFVSNADVLAQHSKRQSMLAKVARGKKVAHRPIGPASPA